MTKDKLFQKGIELVYEQNEFGNTAGAYELLKTMEKDFPDSGRMLNEIAWHILSNQQTVFVDIETAKEYAIRAVSIMKKVDDPWLDLAYDTLAEAYFRLKEFDKMKEYEDKAIKAAPNERKKNYRHRIP